MRKAEVNMSLTDVSEDEPEDSNKDENKRKIEIEKGKSVNSKVPWEGVRRVTIYDFQRILRCLMLSFIIFLPIT